MTAARDGFHRDATDLDGRIAIAVPLPARGRADRPHHRVREHARQRLSEEPQQREAQAVDADVVVFPVGAGLAQRPERAFGIVGLALRLQVAVSVDEVGLAPERALPLRGLLQQMMPGDGTVLRGLEPAVRDAHAHALLRIGQQPAVMSDAGEQAEVALGDAEGHVDLTRVAPARHQPSARRAAARGPGSRSRAAARNRRSRSRSRGRGSREFRARARRRRRRRGARRRSLPLPAGQPARVRDRAV